MVASNQLLEANQFFCNNLKCTINAYKTNFKKPIFGLINIAFAVTSRFCRRRPAGLQVSNITIKVSA